MDGLTSVTDPEHRIAPAVTDVIRWPSVADFDHKLDKAVRDVVREQQHERARELEERVHNPPVPEARSLATSVRALRTGAIPAELWAHEVIEDAKRKTEKKNEHDQQRVQKKPPVFSAPQNDFSFPSDRPNVFSAARPEADSFGGGDSPPSAPPTGEMPTVPSLGGLPTAPLPDDDGDTENPDKPDARPVVATSSPPAARPPASSAEPSASVKSASQRKRKQ